MDSKDLGYLHTFWGFVKDQELGTFMDQVDVGDTMAELGLNQILETGGFSATNNGDRMENNQETLGQKTGSVETPWDHRYTVFRQTPFFFRKIGGNMKQNRWKKSLSTNVD